MTTSYLDFLESKLHFSQTVGKHVELNDIHPMLFPFQRQLTQWALRKGRCALFADTGLGKTVCQLDFARLTNGRALIVVPLAVAQQTVSIAKMMDIPIKYVRSQDDAKEQIVITNYEMLDHFDPKSFETVVLDESSILKSETSKTRQKVIDMFQQTPYRLCCTATPAPNDIAEFANHAEFLGICTRQEMLSMFFVHDEEGWRLKGHAVGDFYRWMASWAMMVKKPSDIGFSDDGFVLPLLNIYQQWVEGNADELARQSGQLFLTDLKGITGRVGAKRQTIEVKAGCISNLVQGNEQWLIWHWLNNEGYALKKRIDGSVLVEGADSLDYKIQAVESFLSGKTRVLISKPSIIGFGLNLQNCHNVIFMGLTDSWETYYQAIRRCWRFRQEHPVNVHIVISDIEKPVLENIMRKDKQMEEVSKNMIANVNEYQRAELGMITLSNDGYHEDRCVGKGWEMLLGDCVEQLAHVPDNSVDFSVFSPPFMSLYTYSASERDMGNSRGEKEFFDHFFFLVKELLRVTKQGRNVACHVMQVTAKLIHDDFIGLKDFRGKVIQSFIDAGFHFHGEVVIDKNPQAAAIRTHAKGLLFNQLRKDSSWLRPGLADFILIFRKPGENIVPIHPDIDNERWIEWAHPIWYGMRETETLNVSIARSEKDERHICPLQLPVIERCIALWSNKGELVLSPFAGIGSEGYQAILQDRRFIGIELKQEYFKVACANLKKAEELNEQGRLL